MSDEQTVTPPNFPPKLIVEPEQSFPPPHIDQLGPLAHLIGTWTNQPIADGKGGTDSPYSYNLMPLPERGTNEAGYILKNFRYYEEVTFSPINGDAPNREGTFKQVANTIFYEQRVYFAEGPDKDKLVHAENGSLLFLTTAAQDYGPYDGDPITPPPYPQQDPKTNVVKQVSVPHGNSILAQGGFKADEAANYISQGASDIGPYPLPTRPTTGNVDLTQYGVQSVGNPEPALNDNPNQPLQDAAAAKPCNAYIKWEVNTKNPAAEGNVANIPFEQKVAEVTDYSCVYWLQSFDGGETFTQLTYGQTIPMNLKIGGNTVSFPHITGNALTKKS